MKGAKGVALFGIGTLAGWLAVAACDGGVPPTSAVLSEPRVLAAGGASNPTVAASPDGGGAYVAWVSTVDDVSDVWLARVDADDVTSEPVRVNDVPGDAAPHLQAPARVAAGPDGAVYVLWQNNTSIEERAFPASDLRFARSTDGGRTFEPAVTVNDDAGGQPSSHTFHDMLVAADGRVVVSWLDGRKLPRPGAGAHAAGRRQAAAAGQALPGDPAASGVDGAAVPGSGAEAGHHAGMAGMGEEDEGVSTVRVAVSEDGGRTFGPGRLIDFEPCPCCRTAMAADRDGSLWLAWRKVYEGGVRDVVVSRSGDGGDTWSPPRRVHEDGWVFDGCPHAGPSLAVDGSGALHAAWYTGREGASGLWHASMPPGGAFGAAEPLVTGTGVPPSQTALAADAAGGVWTAWEERGVGRRAVRLAAPGGGSDGALELAGTNPALAPVGGAVLVAWLAGDTVRVARAETP